MVTDYQHMGHEAQKLDKQADDPTLSAEARPTSRRPSTRAAGPRPPCGNKIQEMRTERSKRDSKTSCSAATRKSSTRSPPS